MRRLSKFLQLSAGIQSCRGNLFNLIVIIISYLPFDFFFNGSELLLSFGHYCEYCVLCGEEFFWFFLCFIWSSVSGIGSVFYKLGVLGPWEFLWRAGSCIYSVLVPLFCEIGGPVQFYLVTVVGWTAGLYILSFFPGSISVGTVRVKR